jgi:RIO kinase 1
VFKDRERYVSGEFRFRKGHCKGNPRKKVKLWAEKEVRNLKRICLCGKINAPAPVYLKNNVIVMEFIGENGKAAPRLKDALLNMSKEERDRVAPRIYFECVMMMRHLYQTCKLVHGDLSEYNLLYFKEKVYMIDVSQSVEHDHPMALDFLRRDCHVMNDFFKKLNVFVLASVKLFNFITDISLAESAEVPDAVLE